ncbi:hypothetical protein HAX54_034170 [Datura stramonium]|uniref:Uncharacterized protein n=1 Tax=Datura stramonium TaxID=4076 RepID=A0ABS8RLS4_DATST|nr:hypothetical protein [Datura stramonium]
MTDQDEQKEVVPDAKKIIIEESDKEVKKCDIDPKTDVGQYVRIDQKHHKEISDDDDVFKQEIGAEIQKSEIILLDSIMNDEVIKKKREASSIDSTNEPLVARRTNSRRAHRRTTDPLQELIRGKSKSKREGINAKDFILPYGRATETCVRRDAGMETQPWFIRGCFQKITRLQSSKVAIRDEMAVRESLSAAMNQGLERWRDQFL